MLPTQYLFKPVKEKTLAAPQHTQYTTKLMENDIIPTHCNTYSRSAHRSSRP